MDRTIRVYGTVIGGAKAARAVDRSAATVGFESSRTPPPGDVAVGFVDFPFTDEGASYEEHLAVVKEYRPELTVAPDVERGRSLADVLDQADELAEYAGSVVVVPKEVHPSEIPDRFRVGVPLANYGSDAPHELHEYTSASEVHLLGGSPTLHRELSMTLPVASVDTASVFAGASNYSVWTWPGRFRAKAWVEAPGTDYYDRITASYDNVHAALHGADFAEDVPVGTVEEYDPDDPASVPEELLEEAGLTVYEYSAMLAGMGPPPCQADNCVRPAEGTEEGWTYCAQHLQAFEWTDEQHSREQEAVEAARSELSDEATVAVTDGGTAADPNRDMSSNTDVPLQVGNWTRTDDDPLTYEYQQNDLLRLRETTHGYGVWFYDEGDTNSGLRLHFSTDRGSALAALKRALKRDVTNLRGEYRQRWKDTTAGTMTLSKSDVLSAAYPSVKGKQAEVLAFHFDTLRELRESDDAELLSLPNIGAKTVDGLRHELADDDDDDDRADDHAGMWDCIEADDSKQLTYRATDQEHVTHIEVLECETCGRRYVGETEYGDQVGEMVDFGYSEVTEILSQYDLESDADFPPARRPDDDTPADVEADDGNEYGIPDSGLTRDDPVTDVTGVGASSDLLGSGFETVGEWWDGGAPFYGVAGAWQSDALRQLLGAEFVDPDDPADLMRVFTGYTNGAVYDREGEKLGGLPAALFGQIDWETAAWAWYTARLRNAEYRPKEMETPRKTGSKTAQFAFATGEELPRDVLTVGPDDVLDPEGYGASFSGLSGLHNATGVEELDRHPIHRYTTDDAGGHADVHTPTVEFLSTLFGVDFTNPANFHLVELVVKAKEPRFGGPQSSWVAVFHHPRSDAAALVEGDALVVPADFNLAGETYDPLKEWAEQEAMRIHDRREAFEQEMEKAPPELGTSAWLQQFEEQHYDGEISPSGRYYDDEHREEHFPEFEDELAARDMASVYDPTQEFEDDDDEADVADERMSAEDVERFRDLRRFGTYRKANETDKRTEWVKKLDRTTTVDGDEKALMERVEVGPNYAGPESRSAIVYLGPVSTVTHKLRPHQILYKGDDETEAHRAAFEYIREAQERRNEGQADEADEADDDLPNWRNPDGTFNDDRMRDAYYWAAQTAGWFEHGPNAGIEGTYYVSVTAGRPVVVMDGAEWNESHVNAVKDGLRDGGFPPEMQVSELSDEWRLFVEPTDDRLPSNYFEGDWRDFESQSDFTDTERVVVHLSAWDASTTTTALNRVEEYDLADKFVEGYPAVDAEEAQTAVDALVDYSESMEPGGVSIMGEQDDSLGKIEGAVRAFEAVDVEATDSAARAELAAKVEEVEAENDDESDEWEPRNDGSAPFDLGDWVYSEDWDRVGQVKDIQAGNVQVETDGPGPWLMVPPEDLSPAEDPNQVDVDALHGEALEERAERQTSAEEADARVIQQGAGIAFNRARSLVNEFGSADAVAYAAVNDRPAVEAVEGIGAKTTEDVVTWATEVVEQEPAPTEEPEPSEDVADLLVERGVNRITANHLADQFGSVEEVAAAVDAADDLTDLRGVGDGSAPQVAAAFDVDHSATEEPTESADVYDPTEEDTAADRSNAGRTLVLVGCGAAKRDETTAAKDLYTSSYFELKRSYAEAVGDQWHIMSAEHALLDPDETVAPYDTHISDVDPDQWAQRVRSELPPVDGATVVLLAGKAYTDPLVPLLEDAGADVELPTAGMGIGERMGWLKNNRPETAAESHQAARKNQAAVAEGVTGTPQFAGGSDPEKRAEAKRRVMESRARREAESAAESAPSESDDDSPSDDDGSAESDGELPWPARKALGHAWRRYKTMLREGKEAEEETGEYLEVRDDGEDAAAEINEIRAAYGQEPIDFEGVEDIEAEGVSGPLTTADTGSSFSWSAKPYDPTEEDL